MAGEALLIHEAAIEVLADAVNIRALVTELERDGALDLLAAVSHRRGIQLGPADRALSFASTEAALALLDSGSVGLLGACREDLT